MGWGKHIRVCVVAACVVSACCKRTIVKPAFRAMSSAPPGTLWLGPITLVADNQQFHIGNEPFLFRSGFTDGKFSASAVRVPQQDLFGSSLFTLVAADSRGTLVHLGDAMDLSCADEWDTFERILDGSGRSWFWTPGNHDGYFFGNFVGPQESWNSACKTSSVPMKKDQILAKYLAHLQAQNEEARSKALDPAAGSFSCATDMACRGLRAAAWHIEGGATFYRSFVLQEIELPSPQGVSLPAVRGASLILIDTSAYERPPRIALSESRLRYAAGERGHLGVAQLAVLERWLIAAASAGRRVILAGHHPFNDIDESDRTRLQALMAAHGVATYISAHTHWGTYYSHPGTGSYAWLEPNLGSVLDYDAEFGELSLGVSDRSDRHLVRMKRIKLLSVVGGQRSAQLGITCDDNPQWFPRPADPDFFTNYKMTTSPSSAAVDKLYFSTMLAALDRYWRCVPTLPAPVPLQDECVPQPAPTCTEGSEVSEVIRTALASGHLDEMRRTALKLLQEDSVRAVNECQRRAYEVCQALWAAEYEKRNYTTPSRDEDIFEVATPPASKP